MTLTLRNDTILASVQFLTLGEQWKLGKSNPEVGCAIAEHYFATLDTPSFPLLGVIASERVSLSGVKKLVEMHHHDYTLMMGNIRKILWPKPKKEYPDIAVQRWCFEETIDAKAAIDIVRKSPRKYAILGALFPNNAELAQIAVENKASNIHRCSRKLLTRNLFELGQIPKIEVESQKKPGVTYVAYVLQEMYVYVYDKDRLVFKSGHNGGYSPIEPVLDNAVIWDNLDLFQSTGPWQKSVHMIRRVLRLRPWLFNRIHEDVYLEATKETFFYAWLGGNYYGLWKLADSIVWWLRRMSKVCQKFGKCHPERKNRRDLEWRVQHRLQDTFKEMVRSDIDPDEDSDEPCLLIRVIADPTIATEFIPEELPNYAAASAKVAIYATGRRPDDWFRFPKSTRKRVSAIETPYEGGYRPSVVFDMLTYREHKDVLMDVLSKFPQSRSCCTGRVLDALGISGDD